MIVGEVSTLQEGYDWSRIHKDWEFNFISFAFISHHVLQLASEIHSHFQDSYILVDNQSHVSPRKSSWHSHSCTIVNVTSTTMIPNIPNLGIACAIKVISFVFY